MKLYELTADFRHIANAAEMAPEDDQDLFAAALLELEGDITDKVEGCCRVLATLKAEADAFRTEEKRLADRRRTIENNHTRLKQYVQDSMTICGRDKLKTELFSVRIAKGSQRVEVTDLDALPEAYTITETKPLKTDLARALKAGKEIPGAELVTGPESLRIR